MRLNKIQWVLRFFKGLQGRLGRFGTPCSFQLFLGTPCIDMPKKCHSSTQKSKPRPGACLEEASVDQWETRFELADPWLVQTYFFKVSSGPGLWLLWSTMQLFRLIYARCPQKYRVSQIDPTYLTIKSKDFYVASLHHSNVEITGKSLHA